MSDYADAINISFPLKEISHGVMRRYLGNNTRIPSLEIEEAFLQALSTISPYLVSCNARLLSTSKTQRRSDWQVVEAITNFFIEPIQSYLETIYVDKNDRISFIGYAIEENIIIKWERRL